MTFSKNMIDYKDFDLNAKTGSAPQVCALMEKQFPGTTQKQNTMIQYFLSGTSKTVSFLLALFLIGSLQGCMYFYKIQTVKNVTPKEIKKYDSLNKYLIVHQGDSAWHLSKPVIAGSTFSGDLSVLSLNRLKYQTTKEKGGNRYKNTGKNDESHVLYEVHLYLNDTLVPKLYPGDNIQIAFSAIDKAVVYQKAKGRTIASWLVPAIGVPILGVAIFIIIMTIDYNANGLGTVTI
jgi:hypothetical protein